MILQLEMNAQFVEWSNQQKLKSRTNYSMVLGENGSGYFLIRAKDNEFSKDLIVERYKSNLANDVTKEFWQPPSSYIEKVLLQPSGMFTFALARNNVEDKYDFLYWKVDDNVNPDINTKPLFQIDVSLIKNKSSFYIKQSADKTKIVIMYLLRTASSNASVLVSRTYSNAMELLSTKQFKLEYAIDDIYITSFEIDNEGNAFVLIDYPKTSGFKHKSNSRKFFLYGLYLTQNDLTEYELGSDTLDINDIGMVVNQINKSISISGFYRTRKEHNSVDGMLLYTLDIPTEVFKVQKTFYFDRSMINKITSVISNDNSPGLSDLLIRKIIPKSDGGCLVMAEKFYETKQTYTYYVNGFPQTSSKTIYNFDEIIVFSLAADGQIQFNDVIKKRQSSINDGGYYSSFVTANTNNSIALIYSLDASAEADIMISTITPKGEIDTRILIKSMSYYVSLMPPESKQVSSNVSLICALKDRKFSVMKITF